MRAFLQRVSKASVKVEGEIVGKIEHGFVVLVGFEPTDTQEDFQYISKKINQLRVFNDENGIMNLSLQQVNGRILVVSQFTLHALTKKGNRPSYIKASKPELAKKQYQNFLSILESTANQTIETGVFGADMKIELLNDGPVSIFIDSKNRDF